jgi:predicted  nucleic acid-binding Zn-ribbon protein
VEDKEAEVRRARIELDTSRYREPVGPVVDEQELDELRMDLSKKQRELVNLRFELEDKQYQLDGANNSMGLLKTTLSEYQQQQEVDREQYDSAMRERNLRERNLQDEIARLGE